MGAGKWSKCDDSPLQDRRVAIIPDNDQPGRQTRPRHRGSVCTGRRARGESIVELPGEGKDASDWIGAGGTAGELLRLFKTAADVLQAPDADRLKVR